MMGDDKRIFSKFVESMSSRKCKQVSTKSRRPWWKSVCGCSSRFSEEFVIENIYENFSDVEWNEMSNTQSSSAGGSTEQVVVMETNMLSSIPECFSANPDVEMPYLNKKSIFRLKPPSNGDVIGRKWSPIENWEFGCTAGWDSHEYKTNTNTADERENDKKSLRRKEAFREKHPFKKSIFAKKGYESFENNSESYSYSCSDNESQSKIKFKTKLSTNTKKRKTKLTSKVQGNFQSSGKIETSFSFASYVKRGNQNFHSTCTQKFTAFGNTDDSQQPLKHNVTFNPIFQDEEPRVIDPRNYRLYTIEEEPEE